MTCPSITPSRARRRTHITWIGALAVAAFVALPATTEAVPLTFGCASQDSGTNPSCSAFESAYSVEVTSIAGDDVFFKFFNNGLSGYDTGSINTIYFDVPSANPFSGGDTSYSISSGGWVSFEKDSSPNDSIPGFSSAYRADSRDGGLVGLGVDEGEWVGFQFDLRSSFDFNDVLSALTNGSLRMALGVDSLDPRDRKSALFINNPYSAPTNPTPVPEPASMLLLGSGLAGIAGWARRRRRQGEAS